MGPGRKIKLRILSGHDVPAERRGQAALTTLIRIFGRMTARGSETAKRHGLTLSHLDVLLTLGHGEGVNQQELAERLLQTKGNICVIVQKMEAAGLIERRPDPEDQRCHRLYLTPAGKAKLGEILPEHQAMLRRMLQGFTQADQSTLLDLLSRIDEALNEDED